jgi:Histidine kinase
MTVSPHYAIYGLNDSATFGLKSCKAWIHSMNKRRKNIFYTVIGCLLFLALPLIVSTRPPEESAFLFTLPVFRDVITNGVILLFFFINYEYFIPHLYFTRKYAAYAACILFCLLCICMIPIILTGDIRPPLRQGNGSGDQGPMEQRPMDRPMDSGFVGQGPGGGSGDRGPMDQGPPMDRRPPMDGRPMDRPMDSGVAGPGPGYSGGGGRGAVLRGPARRERLPWGNGFLLQISHSIYLYIAVILFSILLKVRDRLYQLQKEKIDAELSSLKSQINPHFLFNTLNSIYALAVKGDEKTADAVINLAGLMRYMIKEAHGDKISLQKELDYLTNYVELQKARLRETAAVSLNIKGQAGTLEIAPLILITFVENAFKYGINPDMESRISIDIDIHDGILDLSVFNTKVAISSLDLSTGIGLANTRGRLEKLYFMEHGLEITDEKDYYKIFLFIHLI